MSGSALVDAALARFEGAWSDVEAAPREGTLQLIVRRPGIDQRESLEAGRLDVAEGLEGDGWAERGSSRTPRRRADVDAQVTLVSTRVLAAIERDRARWPLAGDQLYVDVNLSVEALPPGSRLSIGDAVVELSETPHTGCAKFSARFGSDALRWINSPRGRELRMRGANARVVKAGTVRVGDTVRPVAAG